MNGWLHLSDIELLFVVMALLYLTECTCWVRDDAICFTSGFRHHRRIDAPIPLQTAGAQLVLTNPLPFATSFTCQAWPLPLDPRGIVVAEDDVSEPTTGARGMSGRWVSYDEVQSVKWRGREVFVNGRTIAALATETHAAFVAARLQMICGAKPEARGSTIEMILDEIMDAEAVAKRLTVLYRAAFPLRCSCSFFLAYTFAIGPLLYYLPWPVWVATPWFFLVGFVGCWLLVAFQYASVRQTVVTEDRGARIWHVLMLLLSPASAMRAAETVSRNLLAPFDPLAVASVICSPESLRSFAERVLRELRYAGSDGCTRDDSMYARTEDWFRQQMLARAERLIRRRGLDPESLVAKPERLPGALSYCPRCLVQYVLPIERCEACGGIPVLPFEDGAVHRSSEREGIANSVDINLANPGKP